MHVDLMCLNVDSAEYFVLTAAGAHEVSIEEVPCPIGAITGDGVTIVVEMFFSTRA